jgi:hypothetical protein
LAARPHSDKQLTRLCLDRDVRKLRATAAGRNE